MAAVVLNASPSSPSSSSLTSEEIVKRLRVSITSLKASHMSEDGSQVDYAGMAASTQFKEYTDTASLLVNLQPSTFSQDKRKAFFLNMYNSMTVHAMVHQATLLGNLPQAPKDVAGFWSIHCYNIGGLVYSLDEIEHGVLRANRGHPNAGKQQFEKSDPRSAVALSSLDPRIHFALNCGARSCPPIRIYTEEKIEKQLDMASKSFLGQEVEVKDTQTKLTLVETSKLLLWYGADFGANDRAILEWVAALLGPEDPVGQSLNKAISKGDVQLVFRDYNWEANSGDGK